MVTALVKKKIRTYPALYSTLVKGYIACKNGMYLGVLKTRFENSIGDIHSVNIGGGPGFSAKGWRNLEGVRSLANPSPFQLSPECVFPFATGSIETVYNSHNLEHLDEATVARVIQESLRILRSGGRFVLKIPDYDRARECWLANDASFFGDSYWGYDSANWTWVNRGVTDSLDNRAAMLFCGFWNEEYGNHFARKVETDKTVYHGPPVLDKTFYSTEFRSQSPRKIAADLRAEVLKAEGKAHFNHQSAWSKAEMTVLLEKIGFKVASTDSTAIQKQCAVIPGIKQWGDQSAYYLAVKQ